MSDEAKVEGTVGEEVAMKSCDCTTKAEADVTAPAIVNEAADAIMAKATSEWEKLSISNIHRKVFSAAVDLRQLIIDQVEAGKFAESLDTAHKLQTLIYGEQCIKQSREECEELTAYLERNKQYEKSLLADVKKVALSRCASDVAFMVHSLHRQHEHVVAIQEAVDKWNAQKALRNGEV